MFKENISIRTSMSRVDPIRDEQQWFLEWFGFDLDAPPPPDDGLSTVEVNEVN